MARSGQTRRGASATEPGGFSPARVSWREWVALAAGLVAVGSLFLPWTNLAATRQDIEDALNSLPADEVARNAFTTGFLACTGPLIVVLTGVAVVLLGQRQEIRVSGLPQLWLIAIAVAVVLMVLAWLGMGWQFSADVRDFLQETAGVAFYGGIGRYLGMLCGVVSLVAAFLDVRASRRH